MVGEGRLPDLEGGADNDEVYSSRSIH